MSQRKSSRVPKRKIESDDDSSSNGKKTRSCEKTGCFETKPNCCLMCTDTCTKSGYTSRWYHISLGEHFCNNCFDNLYRPNKPGHEAFSTWCDKWARVSRASKPNIKQYVANELLPYWVKCTHPPCSKWRKVVKPSNIDSHFIKKFKCSEVNTRCEETEDKDVSLVLDASFMSQLSDPPLLKQSPAGPYLKRFIPEDIGLYPIDFKAPFKEIENIQPFLINQVGESPAWVKPDELDEDEQALANQVAVSFPTYLGLKNFLVALWNLNPHQWLTIDAVNEYLICKGLVRIYLLSVAGHILDLITKKSMINFGIIQNPSLTQWKKDSKKSVLVIGAGTSGLAAASHLHNLGYKVTVFEAGSELGGRVKDASTLGSGAFFIEGLTNNPVFILACQAGANFQVMSEKLAVFKDKSQVLDKIVSKAFNEVKNVMYGVMETVSTKASEDKNCYDVITEFCIEMSRFTSFCQDKKLFNHLLSVFEIDFKVDMRNLSIANFEFTSPLAGKEGFIPTGLRMILIKLAQNLEIKYNQEVTKIDYTSDEIKVTTSEGDYFFSKVLVTVPLSVLQSNCICFEPELPEFKTKALGKLGNFYCEKLIMEFSKKFWATDSDKLCRRFGVISSENLFQYFIDVTPETKNSTPTLVTVISQNSLPLIKSLTEKEILDKCMSLLKSTFSGDISYPSRWCLTRWKDYVHGGSYGSYLKVGSKPSAYDDMAKDLDNKVYFAGEASFRNIPSTIAGAFFSGLREAAKITKDFELE